MTASILGTGFVYHTAITDRDGNIRVDPPTKNLLPQVAIDHIAGLLLGTTAPIGSWYVGLLEGNVAPDAQYTAASLPAIECIAYSEGTRPEWVATYDGTSILDSLSNVASFTFNADKRIYGAFIVSTSAKGGSTGILMSIARFSDPKDISAGETFTLGAGLTLIPTSI